MLCIVADDVVDPPEREKLQVAAAATRNGPHSGPYVATVFMLYVSEWGWWAEGG